MPALVFLNGVIVFQKCQKQSSEPLNSDRSLPHCWKTVLRLPLRRRDGHLSFSGNARMSDSRRDGRIQRQVQTPTGKVPFPYLVTVTPALIPVC